MRVIHFITTLAVGGAEQMLLKLLRALDRSEFEPTVVTLVNDGALIEVVRDMGIEVQSLDLRRGEVSPRALRRLVTILRDARPDLVQSWMYHSNIAAKLASLTSTVSAGAPARASAACTWSGFWLPS